MIKVQQNEERYEDIQEVGYLIEAKGLEVMREKEKNQWYSDEALKKINKHYEELRTAKPYLKDGPSRDKCVILEKEAELMLDKIKAYEAYSDLERHLRFEAVNVLKRHERQLFGKTKEASEAKVEEVSSSSWMKVRVKMIRAQIPQLSRNADEDDRRPAEI